MSAMKKTAVPPSATVSGPISLLEIGRRISQLNTLIEKIGEHTPSGSIEAWHKSAECKAQSQAFAERDALTDLAAFIRPHNAADVLVHLGVAVHHLAQIDANELEQEEINRRLAEVLRLNVAAMAFLSQQAGIGIEEVSDSWTAEQPAALWPDVEAVATQAQAKVRPAA